MKLAPQIGDCHPPENELNWTLNYGVCTAEFDADQEKFTINQVLPAQLGRHYEVVAIDHIPSISQSIEVMGNPHLITFQNKTTNPVKTLHLGFIVDNSLIAVEQDVGGLLSVSYPANSTYYVACYHNIDVGELVEEGIVLEPVKLHYEPGTYSHIIKANKEQSGEYTIQHESHESTDYYTGLDEHQLTVQNATDRPWYFGVYQTYPKCLGLTSVAWQVCGVAPSFGIPTTHHIKWSMDIGVCITEFDEDERRYMGVQYAPATVNRIYEVAFLDGIPSISPTAVGLGRDDSVLIVNNTCPHAVPVSVGFTLGNNIAAIANIEGHQETMFRVQPTYFVACYNNLALGQQVDEGAVIGPLEVKYDKGVHNATVEVFKDIGGYHLKVVTP